MEQDTKPCVMCYVATVSCLVELGENSLRKKTMCMVATVLKLDPRNEVICNKTYGKVVCM